MKGDKRRTGSVKVLVVVGHHLEHLEAKRDDLASQLPDLVAREDDALPEAEVLGDAPHGPPLAQRLVPPEQLLRLGDVLGDGLLAEDVLPRGEGLLDVLGLGGDGEGDDDGVDVGAGEERVEGVGGGGGREVDVGGGGGGLGEGGGGGFGAGVDCLEGEGVAGLDGGEVLCAESACCGWELR